MKGLPRSLSRGAFRKQEVIKQDIQFDTTITISGATGVGYGTLVLGDFPVGQIVFNGAHLLAQLTESSDNIVATFDGDIALGTTPMDDATATGTDVDLIASSAITQAIASVASVDVVSSATEVGTVLDNSDGALEINLNVLIDDADIDADDIDVAIEGVLTIQYSIL